jgi:hypothetical protein
MITSIQNFTVPCEECGFYTSDLWKIYLSGAIPSFMCEKCTEDYRPFATYIQKVDNDEN